VGPAPPSARSVAPCPVVARPGSGHPPRLLERPPQQELDLPVQAAQVIVGPTLDGVEHLAIDAKQERFAFGHVGTRGRGRGLTGVEARQSGPGAGGSY